MNIVQKLIDMIRALFGLKVPEREQQMLVKGEKYAQKYESTDNISFTAIFSDRLATMAVADSEISISTENGTLSKRSDFIYEAIKPTIKKLKKLTSQALGKGGKFLVPYISNGKIYVQALDQTQCIITSMEGDAITSLSILADVVQLNGKYYQRLTDYSLDNRILTIRNRAAREDGTEVPLETISSWADITPEFAISNVEKIPVAYLICPRDSRKGEQIYGVPITYGAEDTIRELEDCIKQIEREYKSKEVFVGADEMLFGKENKLPKDGIFKVFRSAGALDKAAFWTVFDPAIRDSAYYSRYNSLCARLEQEVGSSKGILTEPASHGATATEIKAALHDTWSLVTNIREALETAVNDLCYAIDLYAEHFELAPTGASGDFIVKFDWDMSMLESSVETFNQLSELESRGLIKGARLNAWVTGQSIEEAQAEIDEVNAQTVTIGSEELEP